MPDKLTQLPHESIETEEKSKKWNVDYKPHDYVIPGIHCFTGKVKIQEKCVALKQ